MTIRARPILMAAAASALALPIGLPALAADTAPVPKSEHHGMSMEGQTGMMGHKRADPEPGPTDKNSGSMTEDCQQMMDAMSKDVPASGTAVPKSDRHGC